MSSSMLANATAAGAERLGGPPEVDHDTIRKNIHIVEIDDDLAKSYPDLPPLETNLDELPPPWSGDQNEFSDKRRYNKFEVKFEQRYFERIRLSADRRTVIRCHRDVDDAVKEMTDAINKSGLKEVLVGLDSEKELSTLQTSICIPNYPKKGRKFEKNILFQIRSVRDISRNIFKEGVPTSLRNFLRDPRLIFIGKAIKGDIKYLEEAFKYDRKTMDKMKYIELDQVYNFVFNLLWHPDYARLFLQANHDVDRQVNTYWSILGNVSLKTIVMFAFRGKIISKRMEFRDHTCNFDEHRGTLHPEEVEYAILDSVLHQETGVRICEEILGIRTTLFTRLYGRPAGELQNDAILRILSAMVNPQDLGLLSPVEKVERLNLIGCRESDLHEDFIRNQFNVRFLQKKKEWALARLKAKWGPPFILEYTPVSTKVHHSRPFKSQAAVIAKVTYTSAYGEDLSERSTERRVETRVESPSDPGPRREKVLTEEEFWESANIEDPASKHAVEREIPDEADDERRDNTRRFVFDTPSTPCPPTSTGEVLIDLTNETSFSQAGMTMTYSYSKRYFAPKKVVPRKTVKRRAIEGSSADGSDKYVEMDDVTPKQSKQNVVRDLSPLRITFHPNSAASSSSAVSLIYPVSASSSSATLPSSSPPPPSSSPPPPPSSSPPRPVPPPPLELSASLPPPPSVPPSAIPPVLATATATATAAPKMGGAITPLRGYAQTVLENLVSIKDVTIAEVVEPLKSRDKERMVDDALAVLSGFVERVSERRRRVKVAKVLMGLFSGSSAHSFALRVITANVLQRGRIHAIHVLSYFVVSEFILADYLFARTDAMILRIVVKSFPKTDIIALLRFVARNFEHPERILERMREEECFRPYDAEVDVERWTPWRVRQFVALLCMAWDMEPPEEARPVYMAVALGPCVKAFEKGQMEVQDFFPVCRDLVGRDKVYWRRCYDYLSGRSLTLAASIASFAGVKVPALSDERAPECVPNPSLHSLPHCEGIVVDDTAAIGGFARALEKSKRFAMDFHGTTSVEDVRGRASVVTFVFEEGIFFVFPRLFPEVTKAAVVELEKFPRPVLTFRWEREEKNCNNAFGWKPDVVHDVLKLRPEGGRLRSYDDICRHQTGGEFCRRASFFCDLAIPSPEALRHRAIRACLIYDFVSELKGFGKKRPRPAASADAHDQREPRVSGDSEPHDGAKRKKSRHYRRYRHDSSDSE